MKTIRLYGELGRLFGKVYQLDVKSPAEAIRALCLQVKGFKAYFEAHKDSPFVVKVGKEEKTEETLFYPTSKMESIRIIPVVSGAGNGWTSIIIGVVLIAVAVISGGLGTATASWWAAPLAGTGASMVVGGISQLLAPSPQTPQLQEQTAVDARASYLFNGVVNTIGPGNAVPVGYGTLLVGSQVISAELVAVNED